MAETARPLRQGFAGQRAHRRVPQIALLGRCPLRTAEHQRAMPRGGGVVRPFGQDDGVVEAMADAGREGAEQPPAGGGDRGGALVENMAVDPGGLMLAEGYDAVFEDRNSWTLPGRFLYYQNKFG